MDRVSPQDGAIDDDVQATMMQGMEKILGDGAVTVGATRKLAGRVIAASNVMF